MEVIAVAGSIFVFKLKLKKYLSVIKSGILFKCCKLYVSEIGFVRKQRLKNCVRLAKWEYLQQYEIYNLTVI